MEIRKTTLQDVDTVLDVFAAAKRYMRANGNALQWGDEYPDRSIVTYDIACGSSYVMLENGEIVGTFALFLGEDESYRVIEDGAWHLDQPYGTIHCLASNGKACGVSKACFDFCTAQIGYLRADTHADNRTMQALLEPMAFKSAARSTPLTALRSSHTTTSYTVDRFRRIGSAAWQQYCRSARLPFGKRALFWCSFRSQGRCSNDSRRRR